MLYSWDRLNKIGPIKNNRLSVQIEDMWNRAGIALYSGISAQLRPGFIL